MSMHNKKFIVFKDGYEGKEMIVIFSTDIVHAHMAEALIRMKAGDMIDWKRINFHSVSAGFVDYTGKCYGRSESMSLDSRPDLDTALLGISR